MLRVTVCMTWQSALAQPLLWQYASALQQHGFMLDFTVALPSVQLLSLIAAVQLDPGYVQGCGAYCNLPPVAQDQ